MKTLIYKLRKHSLPIEDKVKIYSMYYAREIKKIPVQEDNLLRHDHTKGQALNYTDRFIKIYLKYLRS